MGKYHTSVFYVTSPYRLVPYCQDLRVWYLLLIDWAWGLYLWNIFSMDRASAVSRDPCSKMEVRYFTSTKAQINRKIIHTQCAPNFLNYLHCKLFMCTENNCTVLKISWSSTSVFGNQNSCWTLVFFASWHY